MCEQNPQKISRKTKILPPCTHIESVAPVRDLQTKNKVAIISCCYGKYEASTKPIVKQSVPCDKIFFTDHPNINNKGNWIIDTTPYHITHNKYLNSNYTNSWKNNKTNYMISKYYKASFMDIPRLQQYDYILVIDGTIEITNKDCIGMLIKKVEKENSNMVCWMDHTVRGGDLSMRLYWALRASSHIFATTKING